MGEAMKPRDIQSIKEDIIQISSLSENYPIESIYGIGKRYSEALRNIGVETVGELARITNIDEFEEVLGIPAKVLRMIRLRALSYISDEIMQAEPFEFPGERLIYIDIETDVHCRKVWLIGLLMEGRFTQFYAETWEQEKEVLERFLAFLEANPGHYLVSYSGTNFDYRVTLNACRRQGLDVGILEAYPHIDLCTILRRCFIVPHHSYALKELGGYLGYPLKQTELDGLAVARAYQRHVESGAPLVAGVLEYNEDDVKLVEHLVDRCFSLRTRVRGVHWGNICVHGGWVFVRTRLDDWMYPHGVDFSASEVANVALIEDV